MLWHFLLETLAREPLPRIPEPVQVMDDAAQAGAYAHEGQGFLAPLYLFHAIQASALIQPGDRVLDLACGPGNQLCHHARITPSARFVGIDAAQTMLDLGRRRLVSEGLEEVDLKAGRMQCLEALPDASIDVAICTMSLHHLSDFGDLLACLHEIRRVLKPEGRVYLADFGRLKRLRTMHYLANRDSRQPNVFREDYFNSLRAAFSVEELGVAAQEVFGETLELKHTHDVPLFVVLLSRERSSLRTEQQLMARQTYKSMARSQRLAFRDMARFFRQGGFPLAFDPR